MSYTSALPQSSRQVHQHRRGDFAVEGGDLHLDIFLRQHILREAVVLLRQLVQEVRVVIVAHAEIEDAHVDAVLAFFTLARIVSTFVSPTVGSPSVRKTTIDGRVARSPVSFAERHPAHDCKASLIFVPPSALKSFTKASAILHILARRRLHRLLPPAHFFVEGDDGEAVALVQVVQAELQRRLRLLDLIVTGHAAGLVQHEDDILRLHFVLAQLRLRRRHQQEIAIPARRVAIGEQIDAQVLLAHRVVEHQVLVGQHVLLLVAHVGDEIAFARRR